MPTTIHEGDVTYRGLQRLLEQTYGPSPDPKLGWHIYPVRQASTGAHVICLHRRPDGVYVALSRRSGDVEHAGAYGVTFGGFVNIPDGEQPEDAAVREAAEESNGALQLTVDRLTLVQARINYGEVKKWHTNHATTTLAYAAWLTDAEAAAVAAATSDETSGVVFIPLREVAAWQGRIAYPHEYQAVAKLAAAHA